MEPDGCNAIPQPGRFRFCALAKSPCDVLAAAGLLSRRNLHQLAPPAEVVTERWDLAAYATAFENDPHLTASRHVEGTASTAINWEKLLDEVESERQTSLRSSGTVKWFVVHSHLTAEGQQLLQQADRVVFLCNSEQEAFEACVRNRTPRVFYQQILWPNHYRRR